MGWIRSTPRAHPGHFWLTAITLVRYSKKVFGSLVPLFTLYVLTPGRRIYVLNRVRKLAQEQQLDAVVKACDGGIAQDRRALDLDAERLDPLAPTRVRDKDQIVDQTLITVDTTLGFHATVEQDQTALELRSTLFPAGVNYHTRQPHIEQCTANARVLDILEGQEYAQWVQANGLGRLSKSLRKAHDDFEAALQSRDDFNQVTWDQVKAARARGQELYLKTVVQMLAAFPEDQAATDKLMTPIWQEEERVRDFRRQRKGALPEVDPESGEILEAPADAEAPGEPPAEG